MPNARVSLPLIIGHRGAAADAPENTLASFAEAKRQGASWVELDVQLSADGVPFVFHDDDLNRTSTGLGRLTDHKADVLSSLDAGAWFGKAFVGQRIPTLQAALDTISTLGLGVNIEIKADEQTGQATAEAALAVARTVWPTHAPAPLLSSFALSALEMAQTLCPEWPRALLADSLPDQWQKLAHHLDCRSLNLNWRRLTPTIVQEIKNTGLGLLAYTVNHPAQAERLRQWGVDGFFTDKPFCLASSFAVGG